MEFIKVPCGYLLDWLCRWTGSYGIALILFSLIIKLVLLPASIKSKKSSLKMARLSPRLKALEIECGDDKTKYQQEAAKLYKEEGVGMFGGCLWSLLPLLIVIPLYYVIREPLTYLMHFTKDEATQIVEFIGQKVTLTSNQFYHQLEAAPYIAQLKDQIAAALPEIDASKLQIINFRFLGMDLGQIPNWKVWTFRDLSELALFALAVVSAGLQLVSMLISQKMSDKVATDENGEKDEAAVAANSARTMLWIAPAMSLYFCFIMPAAISIYWIAQCVFSTIQDVALTLVFRRVYEEEDRIKQERAAREAAETAEKERIRAEKREKLGPDYVDPNTSKKKLRQQAIQEQKAAADAYEASKTPVVEVSEAQPEEDKHFSGDPERPFCRGRAYKPSRYGRKDGSVSE